MISKMVTRRQGNHRNLQAATREYSARIAEALRARLAPELEEGREFPDFEHLLGLLASSLARQAVDLDLVAEDHKTRRQLKDSARQRRNTAAKAMRRKLVAIRQAVAGVYGTEAVVPALGFEHTSRLDNEGLVAAARGVIARLSAGPLNLPLPQVAGAQVETAGWLEELSRLTGELVETLEEVSGSARGTESQLIGKNSTLLGFDQRYNQTAAIVKALMVYSGLEVYAQRLRSSTSRPTPQPTPEPTPGVPLPPVATP